MYTSPQADPVTFWQPSFSQPNVIIVAAQSDPLAATLSSFQTTDPTLEVVHVYTPQDAQRLVERGRISAIAMLNAHASEGWLQLLIGGLARTRPPRFLLASNKVRTPVSHGAIRLVAGVADVPSLRGILLQCVKDWQSGADKAPVSAREFLAAAAATGEAAWIRITARIAAGDICFRNGVAIYAECGRKTGRVAADEMLAWPSCEFEYRDFPSVVPPNLNHQITDLIVPGAPPSSAPAAEPEPAQQPPAAVQPQPPPPQPSVVQFVAPQPTEPQATAAKPAPPRPKAPPPALRQARSEPAEVAPVAQTPAPPPAPVPVEQSAQVAGLPDLEEPLDFPDFDFAGTEAVTDSAIEEPQSFGLDADGSEERTGLESWEPSSMPEFDFSDAGLNAALDLRSTVFSCVALMEDGHLEACEPQAHAGYFDAPAMWQTFRGAVQYAGAQKMGRATGFMIRATHNSLLVVPVADTGKLLALRWQGAHFGAAEEMEVHRLVELAAVSSQVISA